MSVDAQRDAIASQRDEWKDVALRRCIELCDAYVAIATLHDLVVRLSDCLTDEGADWTNEGLYRLRADVANTVPDSKLPDWLVRYRKTAVLQCSPDRTDFSDDRALIEAAILKRMTAAYWREGPDGLGGMSAVLRELESIGVLTPFEPQTDTGIPVSVDFSPLDRQQA